MLSPLKQQQTALVPYGAQGGASRQSDQTNTSLQPTGTFDNEYGGMSLKKAKPQVIASNIDHSRGPGQVKKSLDYGSNIQRASSIQEEQDRQQRQKMARYNKDYSPDRDPYGNII